MRTAYLCLLGAVTPGCIAGRSVEEPRVVVRDTALVGGDLRVVADAYNPNPFPLVLRRASLELDVDGLPVGTSEGAVSATLPPMRPVAVRFDAPLALYTDARTRTALSGSRARYRVRGTLDVGGRDRSFEVPFRHEGVTGTSSASPNRSR